MPTPDPMQAVAYARIQSIENMEDAQRQRVSCQLGANTAATLAKAMQDLSVFFVDSPSGMTLNATQTQAMCEAIKNFSSGLLQLQQGFTDLSKTLERHAKGWEREGETWKKIMESQGQ